MACPTHLACSPPALRPAWHVACAQPNLFPDWHVPCLACLAHSCLALACRPVACLTRGLPDPRPTWSVGCLARGLPGRGHSLSFLA